MPQSTAPDLLLHGGLVVDGTGAPAFRADVRLLGGRIAEIAPQFARAAGEDAYDARGCYVAPGFIEAHTHFDATMWWAPDMDPLPGYGVTSTVMGNCGFSPAPVSDDAAARDEMIGIFSFFEDIPKRPFIEKLPWDWRTWSEYKRSLSRLATAVHHGAYVGHIALRLAAMGVDAWTRAATPREIGRMTDLLEDALAAGAMGLSTNTLDHDAQGRSVPTFKACDAEWNALFDVLARHPRAQLQVAMDNFIHLTAADWAEKLERLVGERAIRAQFAGLVPTLQFQSHLLPRTEGIFERWKREGRDFWNGYAHVPTTSVANVQSSLIFAQSDEFIWQEVVSEPTQAGKAALLRDPTWRARARASWDHKAHKFSPFGDPQKLELLDSENGAGPVNLGLWEYAEQLGVHRSDALAEWLLRNGLRSTVHMVPFAMADDVVLRMLRDSHSVGNISDAPAHGQMLCGGGENARLLTDWVRTRGAISVEEAVHVQTGKLARYFGLTDRGELAIGKRADVTVFALDEVQHRPMRKQWDVPDGAGGTIWRWTRDAAPVRLTLANGVATFADGRPTGALPGEMIAPG